MGSKIGYTRSYHWEWLTPEQRKLGKKISKEINEYFDFPVKFPMGTDESHNAFFLLSEFIALAQMNRRYKEIDALLRILDKYPVEILSEYGVPSMFVIKGDE